MDCCEQNKCFSNIVNENEAEELASGFMPKNTTKINKWASKSGESGTIHNTHKILFLLVVSYIYRNAE